MKSATNKTDSNPRLKFVGLALGVLATIDLLSSASAYRSTIEVTDFENAAQWLAGTHAEDDHWPVIVDPLWLEPRARARMPGSRRAAGLPDLRTQPDFWVLSRADEAAWHQELQLRFELKGAPRLVHREEFGGISLSHLHQEVQPELDSLAAHEEMRVRVDGRSCLGRSPTWDCRPGRVKRTYLEVDYRARACMALEDFDGQRISLRIPEFEFGDRLIGHVGFGDFNGRLRSDASVEVEVDIEGQGLSRFVASDAQGWAPFELDTQAGKAQLFLTLAPSLGGTFDGRGRYQRRPNRPVCVEIRSQGNTKKGAPNG